MNYPEEIRALPVYPYLDSICETLLKSPSRAIVLKAETAAGKSTAMPIALLKHFSGKILMLEPRRLAVINIANRVSSLLGENLGETCGYSVHLESRNSEKTRFSVVTDAILIRKLQADPLLEGISVVVIDEFHERSVQVDLALAFLKEAMSLRDDLYVIVMSATIDIEKISTYLSSIGTDGKSVSCPLVTVPGRQFPVEIKYEDKLSVSQAVMEQSSGMGTVLVFLPGIKEIRRVQQELMELKSKYIGTDFEVLILHSSVPFDEQKRVFSLAKEKQRVILSSAIAETSVTVPDVRIVIDSGLCRMNMYNHSLGMDELVTQRESLFAAEQRSGRAGRVAAGRCIRLWSQFEVLSKSVQPEIMRSDLVPLVLECYEWGIQNPSQLSWLDNPSEGAWKSAVKILELLGCIKDNSITELGRACLDMGLHPRLACVALSGLYHNTVDLSTEIAVKVSVEKDVGSHYADLMGRDIKNRVQNCGKKYNLLPFFPHNSTGFSTACALLYGYPDRLAVKIKSEKNLYQFPSGHKASVMGTDYCPHEYLVATKADAGVQTGKIFQFEPLDTQLAENFMLEHSETVVKAEFSQDNKTLRKTESLCYGKIILKQKKLVASRDDYADAVCNAVRENGINWLPVSDKTKVFLNRVQFYLQEAGTDGDSLSKKVAYLQDKVEDWLLPFLTGTDSVSQETVYNALWYYLDGTEIKKHVPDELVLETGRRVKVKYESNGAKIQPVVEVIIQQVFGCFTSPRIMGQPVLLRLLSPARRPLQITMDLENFWKGTWPEICREMKGRYPKHNWDYRVKEE